MKKFGRNIALIMGCIVLTCSFLLAGCKKEEPKRYYMEQGDRRKSRR